MIRRSIWWYAVIVVGIAGAPVRAERLAPTWNYVTGSDPSVLHPNGPGGPSVVILGQDGVVGPAANTDIVAATLHTFSNDASAAAVTPKSFDETLFIHAGGQSTSVTFSFLLSGSISSNSSDLLVTPLGPTKQTVHLDHSYFDITANPYHKMPKGAVSDGYLSFRVHVHPNPEPSSLLLAGIGVPALAWLRRRRRTAV